MSLALEPIYGPMVSDLADIAERIAAEKVHPYIRNKKLEQAAYPVLLAPDPIRAFFVVTLNAGEVDRAVDRYVELGEFESRIKKLSEDPKPFINDDIRQKNTLRPSGDYLLTKNEFNQALQILSGKPTLLGALHIAENIIKEHFDAVTRYVRNSPIDKSSVEQFCSYTGQFKILAASFTKELLPVIGLASEPDSQVSRETFKHGLARAFALSAFETALGNGTMKCPFKGPLAALWNTEFTQGEDGRYRIGATSKPGAMPALIAGMLEARQQGLARHPADAPGAFEHG